MIRLCDLTTLYIDHGSGGGVNTYLEEKARYFGARDDVEHTIVVPGARDDRFDLHGATVHRIKSPRLPWNPEHRVLFRLRAVRRILREVKPTIVEADCAYFLGRTAARALRDAPVPIVGMYHVHLPTFIARSGTAGLGRMVSGAIEAGAWRYLRHCVAKCDRMVVTSPDVFRRLEDRGFDRLDYVPLGVNPELFRPMNVPRPAWPVVIYVGRLSPEKDLDVLFDAFEMLEGEPELHVVGDGPMRKRLEKRSRDNARVRFLGAQRYGPRLAELYATADVFVNPSPNEAFGLSYLEAAASGVPVVAAARGGPLGVVTPDIGLLAEPGDASDFAAKIDDVLAGPARYSSARERVVREFAWDRCFERLHDIYREELGIPFEPAVDSARPERVGLRRVQ